MLVFCGSFPIGQAVSCERIDQSLSRTFPDATRLVDEDVSAV